MEKQFVVMYQSYPAASSRPATLPSALRYNFSDPIKGGTLPPFTSEEAAIEAIKKVNVQQAFGTGYSVLWSLAQLVLTVETKPVIETVVTRY